MIFWNFIHDPRGSNLISAYMFERGGVVPVPPSCLYSENPTLHKETLKHEKEPLQDFS